MSINKIKSVEKTAKISSKTIMLFRSCLAVFCALGLSGDANDIKPTHEDITAPVKLDFGDTKIVPGSTPKGRNKDVDNNNRSIDIPADAKMT